MKGDLLHALHTRQFWMALVAAVLLVLTQGLGLHLNTAAITYAAYVIVSLILGDAIATGAHSIATAMQASSQEQARTMTAIVTQAADAMKEATTHGAPAPGGPANPVQ